VCIAIVLMRKIGRPLWSNPYGITDPNGNPGCFSDCVDRLPIRPRCSNVRARSAYEGSGTLGRSLGGPACFLVEEDIKFLFSFQFLVPTNSAHKSTDSVGYGIWLIALRRVAAIR
jgi:hypothetical protein